MKAGKWIYRYTKGKRKFIFGGLFLVCFNAIVDILKITSQRSIIDGFLNHDASYQMLTYVVFLFFMYIMSGYMFYVIGTYFQKISFYICQKITLDLQRKIQAIRIADYDKERFGRWVAIFGDIDSLANDLFMIPFKLVDFIKLLIVSLFIFLIDRKILLILAVTNGLYFLIMKKLLPIIKNVRREVVERRHGIMIQFEEGNSGLREIINYNSQNEFVKSIEKSYKKYVHTVNKDIFYHNITAIINLLSKWIGLAVGIFFLYQGVSTGKISIGTFFVGYQYMNQFSELFRQVNSHIYELIALTVKAEKIQNTMELISEVDFEDGIIFDEHVSNIAMKDISFSYDGKDDVIKRFNCKVKVNEINVIVGESGKGKSTLIDLFLKNYPTKNGDFIINNTYSLSQISLKSWLSKTGIVCQNPYIFLDSVRNNILLGRDKISDDKIMKVLEIVMLKEYIMGLPNGLDTIIGERGFDISGGQRQRIAIARALVNNNQILIFDESLSAIDEYNRQMILRNIAQYYSEHTILMVTHNMPITDSAYNIIYI